MPESDKKDDDKMSPPSASTMLMMIGTVADTTWRLFTPTIGGTILGIWLDNQYETKPWFTTIGVIMGTVLAFGLVYFQVKKVSK